MKSRLIKTKVIFTIEGTHNWTIQGKINTSQYSCTKLAINSINFLHRTTLHKKVYTEELFTHVEVKGNPKR